MSWPVSPLGGDALAIGDGGQGDSVLAIFNYQTVGPSSEAIAAVLYGIRPGCYRRSWAFVGYSFLVGTFGRLLDLPQSAHSLSPSPTRLRAAGGLRAGPGHDPSLDRCRGAGPGYAAPVAHSRLYPNRIGATGTCDDVVMPLSPRHTAAAAIGIYNLIQNRLLPDGGYVPTNLAVSAGLVGLARSSGCSWADLGMEWRRDGLAWTGAGVAAAAIMVGALSQFRATRSLFLDDRARGHDRKQRWYRTAVRFPLGTALFEEVAFRGVLYGMWRQAGASARRATLVSSSLFGLWHVIPAYRTMVGPDPDPGAVRRAAMLGSGVVGSAMSGLMFVWLRRVSGTLAAPWATHAAFNSFSYLAAVAVWKANDHSAQGDGEG